MRSRMVVVETLYHSSGEEEPKAVSHQYARNLASDEVLYQRPFKVGETSMTFDVGWCGKSSMFHIANKGPGLLEVGEWIVRPGQTMRAEHENPATIKLRCREGSTKCIVTLLPE